MAVARARGPADAVEAQWRVLSLRWGWMREWHESERPGVPYPRVVELIEAAGAEPGLRRLFPFTSHYNLTFSSCIEHPYAVRVPFVEPLRDGRFRVRRRGSGGLVIGETDTAQEAVALVMAHFPDDLRPAVAGTADDLDVGGAH
ncbi:DUF6193 family natural product biosynthesis protein [Embleya sp. NBC_00896]|uniref:DUF6193 family natural product biosynthesis protein n=1 Tax=Embleya sp. NBC_00896 TaxID=2975961 RepID=UPI0038692076|nr:DUF6193 family natural product biosynthesis protein [Embleya sp. NBC_00896]